MDIKDKDWIDHAGYEDMLRIIRCAPPGHRFFTKGTNLQLYFSDAWDDVLRATAPSDRVIASKAVGFAAH